MALIVAIGRFPMCFSSLSQQEHSLYFLSYGDPDFGQG